MRQLVFACAMIALCADAANAATRRYAIIVANDTSNTKGVKPLEYADDDGARYYEMFSSIADDVKLFTVLDKASQRLYPDAAKIAGAPKRQAVLDGVAAIFKQAKADVARGDEVVFYFVLVGHGELGAGGEGSVALLDAQFTRSDLFHEIIAKSPATTNHVIVDACNSYYLVHARGGADDDDTVAAHDKAVKGYLAEEDLAKYPNTGVILSTSTAKESHEWAAYGAGVFSHQLRSALLGAADVNGDGRIEYTEVEAFVSAANLRIEDEKARVQIFARAPQIDTSRPLVDLTASRFKSWLRVPKGDPIRFYLEDARGVRYLDANLDGEHAVVIGLSPSDYYFARTEDGAEEVRLDSRKAGRIDLDRAKWKKAAIASRGAVAEAFRAGLFSVAYGSGFYEGFVGNSGEAPVDAHAKPWAPAPQTIDASTIDAELARLDEAARQDPALKERLSKVAEDVARAVEARRWSVAAELLARAEAGR
jgi:hypothetical protein